MDLSTHHLPEDLGSAGLADVAGVVAHELEHGWLLWVPSTEEQWLGRRRAIGRPEVVAVLEYARRHECDYVLFDSDAEPVSELPMCTW
ncbi:hypothetical protein E1091_00200 [Micromonospora fluostatini]|uniref:DUF5983 domain-containing protein n=1 Tax=Micromonospora fluostatini TaxID=1629071 RepID=A0ABY2DN24_9ACTN|nr:hypothetical protein E1091_00200 [Micromonospora fluostatini]